MKKRKGDLKKQFYINISVLSGFALFIVWVTFLYPKTFIDIKLILALLFIPGLVAGFFTHKKILSICGYDMPASNTWYALKIKSAAYLLIIIPIGNLLVSTFLFTNYLFAQPGIKTVYVKPYNINESYSSRSQNYYTHVEIEFDGIKKRINTGNISIDTLSIKILKLRVSKGLFGYYILKGRKFVNKEWAQ